jgi:hypothetical protein
MPRGGRERRILEFGLAILDWIGLGPGARSKVVADFSLPWSRGRMGANPGCAMTGGRGREQVSDRGVDELAGFEEGEWGLRSGASRTHL